MRGRRNIRRTFFTAAGAALWLVALALLVARATQRTGGDTATARVLRFAGAAPRIVEADLPVGKLNRGDRLLRFDGDKLRACGEVAAVDRAAVGGSTVRLALYPDAGLPDPLPAGTRLVLLDSRATLEWALGRAFSPARRARLSGMLDTMVGQRAAWLRQVFGPVLADFARGVVFDVAAQSADFAAAHESELAAVGRDLLAHARTRWIPLLQDVLWPKVAAHLGPIAERVGDELWAALPLRELASSIAQSVGGSLLNWALPSGHQLDANSLEQWRTRFVHDTAVPILQRHVPEALDAVGAALVEAFADPQVTAALRDTFFVDLLGNPQVVGLVTEALDDVVFNNPLLHARVDRLLDDPRVKRGLFDLVEQLQPQLVALARSFLLDEQGQRLHPELAMLVRVRLIGSEGDWVLVETPPPGVPVPPVPPSGAVTAARPVIRPYEDSTTPAWEKAP